MIDPKDDVISKGILETCKILTSQHFNFLENRVKAEKRIKELTGKGFAEELKDLEGLITSFDMFESCLMSTVDRELKKIPIWHYFLNKVPDLDKINALALVVGIEDVSRFETPTKLWAYCGLHTYMIDVKSQMRWFETKQYAIDFIESMLRSKRLRQEMDAETYRDEVNQRLKLCVWGSGYLTKKIAAKDGTGKLENWNKFLKKICIKISECFDQGKDNGFYHQQVRINELKELRKMAAVEDDNFESIWLADPLLRMNLERQLPPGVLAKANSRAQRETIRLFLSHVFQYWRQMKGMPVKKPRAGNGGEIVSFPGIPLEFTVF